MAKQRGAWRIPGPMFEDWIRLQYADTERGALPERMFHNEQATPSLGSPRTKVWIGDAYRVVSSLRDFAGTARPSRRHLSGMSTGTTGGRIAAGVCVCFGAAPPNVRTMPQ